MTHDSFENVSAKADLRAIVMLILLVHSRQERPATMALMLRHVVLFTGMLGRRTIVAHGILLVGKRRF
jgi:hypothetical protein